MKKILLCGVLALSCVISSFAGDVATFVDKGFSEDGKYYIFGQYGKTDKKFQGWAEIYQVDIEANDYVESGLFKIKPSSVTYNKSGREVFEALEAKCFYYYSKIKSETPEIDNVLYILDDVNKTGTDEIVFKDFSGSEIENPDSYEIRLIPTINGKGVNAKSSFYIDLKKVDAEGNVIMTQKIGSPNIVRKGVSNYKIERIFCDKTKKNMIFIIEKMVEDETGVSIRYMVEAAKIK